MPSYYYHDPDCYYVRVPKTGSTSVTRAFFGKPFSRTFGPIPETWRGRSFAFVRHPVDRFYSAVAMFRTHKTKTLSETYWRDRLTPRLAIELVKADAVEIGKADFWQLCKLHLIPMTHEHFGLDRVEKILRFERFAEEWIALARYLEIETPPVRCLKYAKSTVERDPDVDAEIRELFAADFETFGYT